MNDKEHKELNCWIAESVMGWVWYHFDTHIRPDIKNKIEWCGLVSGNDSWPKKYWDAKKINAPINGLPSDKDTPSYTTDSAEAVKVLKKCAEKLDKICIIKGSVYFEIYHRDKSLGIKGAAETLELAICLFAKELFTK